MCAPCRINSTSCARGRGDHVTLPFTCRVAMLSAVSRAAAGVLRGVKPSLTPQKCQNEGAKIISSLSVNSEYINLTNRYAFLLHKFRFTLGRPWYMATFVLFFLICTLMKLQVMYHWIRYAVTYGKRWSEKLSA